LAVLVVEGALVVEVDDEPVDEAAGFAVEVVDDAAGVDAVDPEPEDDRESVR